MMYETFVDTVLLTTLLFIVCGIMLVIVLVCGSLYLYGLQLLRRVNNSDDDNSDDDEPELRLVYDRQLPTCPFTRVQCNDPACSRGCWRRAV